jgi:hypothetical protein
VSRHANGLIIVSDDRQRDEILVNLAVQRPAHAFRSIDADDAARGDAIVRRR